MTIRKIKHFYLRLIPRTIMTSNVGCFAYFEITRLVHYSLAIIITKKKQIIKGIALNSRLTAIFCNKKTINFMIIF
jgi:hypothetical protein